MAPAEIEMGARNLHALPAEAADEGEEEVQQPLLDSGGERPRLDGGVSQGGGEEGKQDVKPAAEAGPLSAWLDAMPPRFKFCVLVGFVFCFFGLHNFLQEELFAMPDFRFGWSLTFLEAVGMFIGSFLERLHEGTWNKRVAPFSSYFALAGILGVSSSLSNIALKYVDYPTKVIVRSSKLLPTMVIAVVWRGKVVSGWEFMAAVAVCVGLIVFAEADAELEPEFHPIGLVMLIMSICGDAIIPNLQEHVFAKGASRTEVAFFTNLLILCALLVSTIANGGIFELIHYAVTHGAGAIFMLAYTIACHLAISSHLMVLKEYGGVTAVLVGTARKAMTMALSYIIFPKPFGYRLIVGSALVLGGLVANVIIKDRRRKNSLHR